MDSQLREAVRLRSGRNCEYCRMPENCDRTPFQIDHVIAEKHGGVTSEDNLAWSCFDCNVFKGPNIAGIDPQTGLVTKLFHPRDQAWEKHFALDGGVIHGTTPEGRATVATLRMNLDRRVALRRQLIDEATYPPFA